MSFLLLLRCVYIGSVRCVGSKCHSSLSSRCVYTDSAHCISVIPLFHCAVYIQAGYTVHVSFLPSIALCIYHSSIPSYCVYIGSVRCTCAIPPFHRAIHMS